MAGRRTSQNVAGSVQGVMHCHAVLHVMYVTLFQSQTPLLGPPTESSIDERLNRDRDIPHSERY